MSEYILQWESPPLDYYWLHHFVFRVYELRLVEEAIGFQEEDMLAHCDHENFQFFLSASEIERVQSAAMPLFEDKARMDRFFRSVTTLARHVRALAWEVRRREAKGLLKRCLQLESVFHRAVALHLCSQPHLTRVLEAALLQEIRDAGLSSSSAAEICARVTLPTRLVRVMQEQMSWYSLIVAVASTPNRADTLLARHLKRWRFITAGDSKPPMDDSSLHERLVSDLRDVENAREQLQRLRAIQSGEFAEQVDHLCRRHLAERGRRLAWLVREFAFHRFLTKELWMKVWYILETARNLLAEELGGPIDGFTSEELREHNLSVLRENDRHTYLFCRRGGYDYLYYNGLDAVVRTEYLSPVNYAAMTEVHGEVGYPGLVQGVALRIGWTDAIQGRLDEISRGTILVLPQTTPAFVPLLTRCGGLIVDEGGITSHASIISREMRIPSLIGTRVGTKVFSTGQRVELDTNRRVARKLPSE